jgi:hypothetical protein
VRERLIQGGEMYSHEPFLFSHNIPVIEDSGHPCQGQKAPSPVVCWQIPEGVKDFVSRLGSSTL